MLEAVEDLGSSGLAYLGPQDFPTEDHLIDYLLESDFPTISCDVETVSIKDRRLIGIGIGLNQTESVYFRVLWEPCQYLQLAWQLLDKAQRVILHNGIFDLTVLLEYFNGFYDQLPYGIAPGIPSGSIGRYAVPELLKAVAAKAADTSIMGQMQGVPTLELANMTERYVGMTIQRISDILPKRYNMLDLLWGSVVGKKCLYDCLATNRLYWKMSGPSWEGNEPFTWSYQPNWGTGFDPREPTTYWVTEGMLDCYHVGMKLIQVLLYMTARGFSLYHDKIEKWYEKLSQELLTYSDICNREGFNPSSPQQVGIVLANRGSFLPLTKSRKGLKTGEEILEEVVDPLAAVVLEHRRLNKARGTYILPYRDAHRAYTHYRMDLSTARLASYDRSMMNIPDYLREILAPDKGIWTWIDWSQIEMRIMATISQDPVMMAAYSRGEDIHWITQQQLWPGTAQNDEKIRLPSKTFNFAMLYRAQPRTLSKHTKLPTSVCAEYRAVWLASYPGVDKWQLEAIEDGWNQGWAETMYGRRCRLPSLDIAVPDHIEKCAVNYPIQGTGFDILARALLICFNMGMDLALPVHDEIVVDGLVEFPEELNNLGKLYTPFKTHQGPHWV